jgi:hypothetical protein
MIYLVREAEIHPLVALVFRRCEILLALLPEMHQHKETSIEQTNAHLLGPRVPDSVAASVDCTVKEVCEHVE